MASIMSPISLCRYASHSRSGILWCAPHLDRLDLASLDRLRRPTTAALTAGRERTARTSAPLGLSRAAPDRWDARIARRCRRPHRRHGRLPHRGPQDPARPAGPARRPGHARTRWSTPQGRARHRRWRRASPPRGRQAHHAIARAVNSPARERRASRGVHPRTGNARADRAVPTNQDDMRRPVRPLPDPSADMSTYAVTRLPSPSRLVNPLRERSAN